jgi:hypothetical protein
MRLGANSPAFVALLLAHVALGVLGYGANAMAGWSARDVAVHGPTAPAARFFDGRISSGQYLVFGVPVVGVVMLLVRAGHVVDLGWFLGAVTLWLVTIVLLVSRGWPGQREVGRLLGEGGDDASLHRSAMVVLRVQQLVVVCYVVAFVLMYFHL